MKREDLIALLESMQAGSMPLVEGCRLVVGALATLGDDLRSSDAAATIVAVESETDAFPCGPERNRWSDEALHRSDAALAEYIGTVREELLEACRDLQRSVESTG